MLFDGPIAPRRGPDQASGDADVIATVAIENHANAVRLARGEMLSALFWVSLAIPGVIAGIVIPGFQALVLGGAVVLMWAGRNVVEYVRVVRLDPAERWRQDLLEHQQETEAAHEYQARVATATPRITLSLIALITTVTIVEFLTGLRHAIPAAALVKPAVRAGEWWRLFTAAYLHGSVLHITANMTSLWSLGRLVEAYDRPLRIALVFLASALGCSLLSTLLLSQPSLGASGGVMGLVGYLLVTAGAGGGSVPVWLRKRMWMVIVNVAVTGIVGYRYIDNAGHLGGLIAGGAVGWLCRSPHPAGTEPPLAYVSGSLSLAVLLAGGVFTVYRLVAY